MSRILIHRNFFLGITYENAMAGGTCPSWLVSALSLLILVATLLVDATSIVPAPIVVSPSQYWYLHLSTSR